MKPRVRRAWLARTERAYGLEDHDHVDLFFNRTRPVFDPRRYYYLPRRRGSDELALVVKYATWMEIIGFPLKNEEVRRVRVTFTTGRKKPARHARRLYCWYCYGDIVIENQAGKELARPCWMEWEHVTGIKEIKDKAGGWPVGGRTVVWVTVEAV